MTANTEQQQEFKHHCEKHGDFVTDKRGDYQIQAFRNGIAETCPQCVAETKALLEAERKERIVSLYLSESRIPVRFADKGLDTFIATTPAQKSVLDVASRFASEFSGNQQGRCLILHGKVGTGKTHIACGIALEVIRSHQKRALFTKVSRLARNIRESKGFDSEMTESEMIALYVKPDLLIIDEVGLQSNTDAETRAIFDVVDERYENCKATIFISNLDLKAIQNALGQRIYDRAKENGGESVLFNWDSKRGSL